MVQKAFFMGMLAFSTCIVAMAQNSNTPLLKITIDANNKAQIIENIGASGCWYSESIGKYWPAEKKEHIAELLFSKQFDAEGKPAEVRNHFHIDAGNYGFYVYRNKRLHSWAERFSSAGRPIIPQVNDFYAFRRRILLNTDADDVINLDVKKSHVMLSDEAFKALDDVSAAYRRKARRA